VKTAQAQAKKDQKDEKEQKPKVVRAPQKQQPVVVAGSNEPIRPIPVKTMPLDAEGKLKEQKTAQASLFSFSPFSAANTIATPMAPMQSPVIVADASPAQPRPQPQSQTVTPVVTANSALGFAANDAKPHPLAETPQPKAQEQQQQAVTAPQEMSETDELEAEARALAAENKEKDLTPLAANNNPRKHQIAATNSIPQQNTSANEDDGDILPPAAKTGKVPLIFIGQSSRALSPSGSRGARARRCNAVTSTAS
jgi:hypothetical protein